VIGAALTGSRLLGRKENRRNGHLRRARENARELSRGAREDRIAAPQMKRLIALQEGLLESLQLLSEEHRLLLDETDFAILGEVEIAPRLARRRMALRRHLESAD
jgi:hypothetical protein